jgi:FixJ family two-component response regulator
VQKPTRIALVDDDTAVLDSLTTYLGKSGHDVYSFSQAGSLLEALDGGNSFTCIVSDVRMPGLSGLDLQRELSARGLRCPLILITGYGDIATAVAAVKAGAHDFLEKPFDEQRLSDSIHAAVTEVCHTQADDEYLAQIQARVGGLSERQRQVMTLAAQGFTNKEIAKKMDISTRTVESYRSWVMERTGAKNLAELIRMAMQLGMVR